MSTVFDLTGLSRNLLSLVGWRRAARADCWLSFSFWVSDVRDVRLNSVRQLAR